jgi:hypothetical protein
MISVWALSKSKLSAAASGVAVRARAAAAASTVRTVKAGMIVFPRLVNIDFRDGTGMHGLTGSRANALFPERRQSAGGWLHGHTHGQPWTAPL